MACVGLSFLGGILPQLHSLKNKFNKHRIASLSSTFRAESITSHFFYSNILKRFQIPKYEYSSFLNLFNMSFCLSFMSRLSSKSLRISLSVLDMSSYVIRLEQFPHR